MKHTFLIILTAFAGLVACGDEGLDFSIKPALGFESSSGSVLEIAEAGQRIKFYSNAAIEEPVTVTVAVINPENLIYGTDYTTDPAPVNNTITVTIDTDDQSPGFFVYPKVRANAPEKRNLRFEIVSVSGSNLELAQSLALTYSFTITKIQAVTITHNFDGCSDYSTPTGFIEAFESGSKTDRGWGCRAFGLNGSRAPRASAFGGTAGNDKAWMIMDPVTVPQGIGVDFSFWVYSNFSGPGTVALLWSSDYSGGGDPLLATWTPMETLNAQFPSNGSKIWKQVQGTVNGVSGARVYFAFRFTGATNSASASWDIDDLTVKID